MTTTSEVAHGEEYNFDWITPRGEIVESPKLSFGSKDYNDEPFKINSIWVSPEDSHRTHKIFQNMILEIASIEIRNIVYTKNRIQVSNNDFMELVNILKGTSPRLSESWWPLTSLDDIFIVFIDKNGKEAIMSWDTPGLLWQFSNNDSKGKYKGIIDKYAELLRRNTK